MGKKRKERENWKERRKEGRKEGGERQSEGDLDAVSWGPISVSHVKTQNPVWLDSREKTRKEKKKLEAQISGVNSTSWQQLDGESVEEDEEEEEGRHKQRCRAERLQKMVEIRVRRTRGGRGQRPEKL